MTRVVVVTGGGKGIARAVVERFAAAGDRVVALGRDRDALRATPAAAELCDVTDEAEAALARAAPLGRLLEPDEVAFAVAFLAAPEAAAINGQTLILDGGGIQT